MSDQKEHFKTLLNNLKNIISSFEEQEKELKKIERSFAILDDIHDEYRGDLAYMFTLLLDRKNAIKNLHSLLDEKKGLTRIQILKIEYAIVYKKLMYITYSDLFKKMFPFSEEEDISHFIIRCNEVHDDIVLNSSFIRNNRCDPRCEGWVGEDKPSSCVCGTMYNCNWQYSTTPHIEIGSDYLNHFGNLKYNVV
jgi:hypothetical protein